MQALLEVDNELDESTINSTNFWQRNGILLCLYLHISLMNYSDEDIFVYVNYDSILITSILNQHFDATFAPCFAVHLPQASESLWYCPSLLLEVWKAERPFTFINRIHKRLLNSISRYLLRASAAIARHGYTILIWKTIIWVSTLTGLWHFGLFMDALFLRYLYIL